jgi:large conductance mechanosensitive channel
MLKDFKKFALRGNVMDLAVAVIIGGAFGKIVTSLVNDVLMPIIGILFGNVNFKELKIILEAASGEIPEKAIYYGNFIQNTVDFIIIAFVIFIMIRFIEKVKAKPKEVAPAPPTAPTEDIKLLTEIRDLLKK